MGVFGGGVVPCSLQPTLIFYDGIFAILLFFSSRTSKCRHSLTGKPQTLSPRPLLGLGHWTPLAPLVHRNRSAYSDPTCNCSTIVYKLDILRFCKFQEKTLNTERDDSLTAARLKWCHNSAQTRDLQTPSCENQSRCTEVGLNQSTQVEL